jgi:hypothetical protein
MWAFVLGILQAAAVDVDQAASTGLLVDHAASTGETGVEWLVGERLVAGIGREDPHDVEVVLGARAGIRLLDAGRVDRLRVRAAHVRWDRDGWRLVLGRFQPEGGGVRLVDGAEWLADVGGGLRIGAWAGAGPDPWDTRPAARLGGGPVATWEGEAASATVLGEVLATNDGLDRLSAVGTGRVEFGRAAELDALVDLQSVAGGVRPSDATLRARLDPSETAHVDAGWDTWSALSYRVTEARDPSLTRFATWSVANQADPWIAQDRLDPTVYHQPSFRAAWQPEAGRRGRSARLTAHARYRFATLPERQRARTGLEARWIGLANGRIELGFGQSLLWWPGHTGSETTGSLWFELDPNGRWAVDTTFEAVVLPIPTSKIFGPSYYADAFLDARVGQDWTLSAGYSFTNSQDLDRWDTYHAALARVTWRIRTEEGR